MGRVSTESGRHGASLNQGYGVKDGDGEAERFRAARHLEGRDTDDASVAIEERPAAVARIDGRIGLNQLDAARVAHSADNPARDRVLQAERGSNREDLLAGQDRAGRTELENLIALRPRRGAHDGKVEVR